MSKFCQFTRVVFFSLIALLDMGLYAAPAQTSAAKNQSDSNVEEKYNLMKRDENSPTDALAIPFDDSEVEDETEVNRDDKREVFSLPNPPQSQKK